MTHFAEKQALSRHDIENPGRVYGNNAFQPQKSMLVAPIFLKSYAKVFKELGLVNAPTDELMAWYQSYLEARASPEWEDDETRLQDSPRNSKIKTLKEEAPVLRGKADISRL